MLFISCLICTVVCLTCLVTSPFRGVLLLLALKPIIDASWNHSFGGYNLLQVTAVAAPLLLLPQILAKKSRVLDNQRWKYLAIGYLICNTLGLVMLLLHRPTEFAIPPVELVMRALSGFLGFFLLAFYFDDREKFRYLLIALLVAGIFPALMGMYEGLTQTAWRERQTVGLIRYVGLYHDGFNFRFYGFQTIAAILLYLSYFKPPKRWQVAALIAYALCWLFVIFNINSKGAVVIACLWCLTWTVATRKIAYLLLIVVALLGVNLASNNIVFDRIETTLSKEIKFMQGELEDERYVLAGRGFIWEDYWQRWKKLDPELKIIGTGESLPVHNEFFRILIANGVIGLMTNIVLLLIIGWMLLRRLWLRCTPINILALMIFQMWLVDCLGVHPGLYPSYQWFVWGMIGLAVTGVKGLDGMHSSLFEPARSVSPQLLY